MFCLDGMQIPKIYLAKHEPRWRKGTLEKSTKTLVFQLFFVKHEECHKVHVFLSVQIFLIKTYVFLFTIVRQVLVVQFLGRYNFNLLLGGRCPILRKILLQFVLVQFWGSWCKTINTEEAPPQEWQTWSLQGKAQLPLATSTCSFAWSWHQQLQPPRQFHVEISCPCLPGLPCRLPPRQRRWAISLRQCPGPMPVWQCTWRPSGPHGTHRANHKTWTWSPRLWSTPRWSPRAPWGSAWSIGRSPSCW